LFEPIKPKYVGCWCTDFAANKSGFFVGEGKDNIFCVAIVLAWGEHQMASSLAPCSAEVPVSVLLKVDKFHVDFAVDEKDWHSVWDVSSCDVHVYAGSLHASEEGMDGRR
jgi:hypothetical protein